MTRLTIATMAEDFRTGKRRPPDVLEEVYAGIARRGEAPAWITLEPFEVALAKLDAAAQRPDRGALFGVPFAVKDNIDVAGLPTTAACPAFSYVPERSATVVERLTRAGAIVVGKTNLDQFATGLVGTRTPYGACSSVFHPEYVSGGSSSGSAVAVARGDVPFSLGTDTAGSGRIPAAFNALVGLKPTPGLFSTRGVVPACRSLDCVSVFANTLADARTVFDVLAGYDDEDPFSRRAPALPSALGPQIRVGVPTADSLEFFGDSEYARLFAAAVARVGAFAELVPVDLTPFRETASLLYTGPWVAERLVATARVLAEQPEAMDPTVRRIVEGGKTYDALDAFRGSYRLAALRRTAQASLAGLDGLLLPTAPTHYKIADVLNDPVALNQNLGTYTNFVNLLDLSALAVPAGFRGDGLPFGVTFVAPAFRDLSLLELARRFDAASTEARPAPAVSGAPSAPPPGCVWVAVAGAHLSGQPLNRELTGRGAHLVAATRTTSDYRLYALATRPPKPGLVRTPGKAGHAIEVEIWELDEQAFGSFVAAVPAPMTIGTACLEGGLVVKGFGCDVSALEGARDITDFGGWRAYLAANR